MDALTFSQVRANRAKVLDRVVNDRTPLVVTRRRGDPVVLISLVDWRSTETSLHLMSTPANAERLRQAMQELDDAEAKRAVHDPLRPETILPAAGATESPAAGHAERRPL